MLRSTFYTFTTALRGMNVAQKGLDVTGHNISNAKTPGYTRQRADIYAAAAGGYNDKYTTRMSTMAGQGAIVDRISQIRDSFLDVRFRRETAIGSEDATKLGVMNDMERFFNEIEKSGLQDSFNTFVSRLQQLSRNVESPEFDNLARDAAQSLAMQLNHYARQLKSVREGQEYNLREVDVPEINDILKKIGELNKSIREVQASGGPALELKDERNLLLDKLAGHADIDVKYTPNYMAGDLMIEDVTVSFVGKSKVDGSRITRPVVYNEAVSKLSVETPAADGTKKSYVTVDSSDLPAKDMCTKIEGYLKAMAAANTGVMHIKGQMDAQYGKYQEFISQVSRLPLTAQLGGDVQTILNSIFDKTTFPKPIADMTADEFSQLLGTGTIDKINEALNKVPGGVIEKLKQVVQEHVQASEAYNRILDDKNSTPQQIKDAREAFAKAARAEADWQTYTVGLMNIRDEIQQYKTNLDSAKTQIKNSDDAIKTILQTEGIDAELSRVGGDYSTGKYTFKRGGNPILGKDGNPVTWKTGNGYKEIRREDLENDLGVDFTKIAKKIFGDDFKTEFDFEELDCRGALRGSLKMLNESGTFDYGSTSDTVRGTGYYEKLLDTLADKLATTLNNLNDRKSTTDVKEHLFQIDPNSKVQDRFTAENIRISKDWLDGKYRLTASQQVQPEKDPTKASARNENLLLMISTITKRIAYDTGIRAEKNKFGLYVDNAGNAVADSIDENGDYVQTVKYENGKKKVPEEKLATPVKVANRDGIKYKPDGTLDAAPNEKINTAAPIKLVESTAPHGPLVTKQWEDQHGNIVADGRDEQGNYTLKYDPVTGVVYDPPRWVADASGVIEYQDGTGTKVANHRDDDGNYILRTVGANGKVTDKMIANKDGVIYAVDANGNLKKDRNGHYIPLGNKNSIKFEQRNFVYNGSFKEYLTNLGNVLGLDVSSTKGLVDNHKTVLNDVQDQRDSVSKVNLDEEGVNMLLYQKAYNASARLMTALDEAVDKIINGMGVVGR